MIVKPWKVANVPGPEMAKILNSNSALNLIKQSKRLLMIVGALSDEINIDSENLVSLAIRFGKKGIPILGTGHIYKEFISKNFKPQARMTLTNIIDRLRDPNWKGLDNKGSYDLVVFLGINYYFESQVLSTLKHFASQIKTISLDREYQPNASFSFPNLVHQKWKEEIEKILEGL